MTENPIMIVMYLAIAVYVGKLYWADTKTQIVEGPTEGTLPGAFPCELGGVRDRVDRGAVHFGPGDGGRGRAGDCRRAE